MFLKVRTTEERDQSDTPAVSYTRGNDLSGSMEGAGGIGGLLARSDGYSSGNFTTHNFYFADGNGNITYMLNSSQSMVASYRYDPFGNTISSSGTLATNNVYRFSSKEIHANSGMYYYGYRFYDPSMQRWINRDPIEELGGINLYRFARNNPVNERDPIGLSSAECEAARQALADALRNFDLAPGPLTQELLVAAVAAEAAACSGDNLPPLPKPSPFPELCKPKPYRTPPSPQPPPLGPDPVRQSFCERHPAICVTGTVVGVGIVVGGIIVLTGGAATPVLIGAAVAL
jgi:RHS repeat-associated protein